MPRGGLGAARGTDDEDDGAGRGGHGAIVCFRGRGRVGRRRGSAAGRYGMASVGLAVVLVVASGLHFLGGQVADPDLWQHLRFGELIWRDGAIPAVDTFSYTAYGEPIVDHEWLAQWLFAGLFALGGSAALVWMKLLLGAALLLLLLDTARTLAGELGDDQTAHPLAAAMVLILSLTVVSPGASFRPQLFTIVLLAAQGALLARADRRLRGHAGGGPRLSWELLAQPVLIALWTNLHGGFLVGVGMLAVWAGVVALRAIAPRRLGLERPAPADLAAALGTALAGIAAPLANPYGAQIYLYLAQTLGMHDEISEWFPVPLLSTEFLRFKLLVVASAAGLVLLWRRRGELPAAASLVDWRAPFFAVAAIYAVRHQRHTVLFAVVAAPLLIVAVEQARRAALRRWPALRPRPAVLAVAAGGALAIAAVQVHGFAEVLSRQGLTIHFGRLDYPADAVEFLRTHGIRGNVAMPFEWGSYAIWKLAPESRVFIDGRFETVYPRRVIDDYFAFMHGAEGWERMLDDYPTDVVVVQRWRGIHPRLFARPDLVYVYSDPAALVFLRRGPGNQAALERLALVADRATFPPPETRFP